MNSTIRLISFHLLYFLLCFSAFSQSRITGVIVDAETQETIIGASVRVKYFAVGTVSDIDGNFSLISDLPLPLALEITALDYQRLELLVTRDTQDLVIVLEPESVFGKDIVVTASRIEESLLESPVSIQRLSLVDMRNTASLDPYLSLSNLEGVQSNTSSMRYTSLNTRGFADAQNWRFVTLSDGVDMQGPGINYALGSINTPMELDILSMELVPGPGSALYGPNAFNGLISLQTKNPFDYQGLSAFVKGGMSVQQAAGSRHAAFQRCGHPLCKATLRPVGIQVQRILFCRYRLGSQ